jgi:hypothetical protein
VYSREYSVHNSLPYRNLTVRGRSSGEPGAMRLVDHLGKRDGLQTHLSRHSAKGGKDSVYGDIKYAHYASGSYSIVGAEHDINDEFDGSDGDPIAVASFWINVDSLGTPENYIMYTGDGGAEWKLYIDSDGKIYHEHFRSVQGGTWKTTDNVIIPGTWQHVVFMYDGSSTGNHMIVYIDGVSVGITRTVTPNGSYTISSGDLVIGAGEDKLNCLRGSLDEFAVWSRILTDSEIKQIYAAGRTKSLGSVAFDIYRNLLFWFAMGELDDDNLKFYDLSGQGRHSRNVRVTIVDIDDLNPPYGAVRAGADDILNFGTPSAQTFSGDTTLFFTIPDNPITGEAGFMFRIKIDDTNSSTAPVGEGVGSIAVGANGERDEQIAASVIDAINGLAGSPHVDFGTGTGAQAFDRKLIATTGSDSAKITLTFADYGTHGNSVKVEQIFGTTNVRMRTHLTGGVNKQIPPAFNKQHRNRNRRLTHDTAYPSFNNNYDNSFVVSSLPRSEFQYSWINSAIGSNYNVYSGKQRIFGYAPLDGIVSSSVSIDGNSGFVAAITFPSSSEIFGE